MKIGFYDVSSSTWPHRVLGKLWTTTFYVWNQIQQLIACSISSIILKLKRKCWNCIAWWVRLCGMCSSALTAWCQLGYCSTWVPRCGAKCSPRQACQDSWAWFPFNNRDKLKLLNWCVIKPLFLWMCLFIKALLLMTVYLNWRWRQDTDG